MIKILVMEDQQQTIDLYHAYLQDENEMDLTYAQDGEAGMAHFNSEKYDLVIVDLTMPKISGIEVLSRIAGEVPTIVISGSYEQEAECMQRGASLFITKPFKVEHLPNLIRGVLKSSDYMLRCLAYHSFADPKISEEDIENILTTARTANFMREITGCLIYRNGIFLQWLEGPCLHVKETYTKIAEDPRHNNAIVVMNEVLSSRFFPDWRMVYDSGNKLSIDWTNEILRLGTEMRDAKSKDKQSNLHKMFEKMSQRLLTEKRAAG